MAVRKRSAKTSHRARVKRQIRSNRRLHKKLLLHPTSVFIVLCAGVFICGWTYKVIADTFISSTIEAPALQSAATIASPSDNAVITTAPTYVTGACPTNSYLILKINGSFSGVAWCGTDNAYSITASLYDGTNKLTVQAYNQTDLAGPATPSIQLQYQPQKPAAASTTKQSGSVNSNADIKSADTVSSGSAAEPTPILISSDFQFKTFSAQKDFSWQIDLEGGTPPYKVHISWGDGQTSDLVFKTDPVFTIRHAFQTPGYYPVEVRSVDTKGQTKVIQLAALINDTQGKSVLLAPVTPGSSNTSGGNTAADKAAKHWLALAWPSYIVVALMMASFWLGERREYASVLTNSRGSRRRR